MYITDRGRPAHVLLTFDAYEELIGGTALTHRMPVVTRDHKDFSRFDGLDVLNPWR